jgi:hypothetical protein
VLQLSFSVHGSRYPGGYAGSTPAGSLTPSAALLKATYLHGAVPLRNGVRDQARLFLLLCMYVCMCVCVCVCVCVFAPFCSSQFTLLTFATLNQCFHGIIREVMAKSTCHNRRAVATRAQHIHLLTHPTAGVAVPWLLVRHGSHRQSYHALQPYPPRHPIDLKGTLP